LDLFEPDIAFRGILWLYSAPRCVLYLLGAPSYLQYAYGRDGVSLTFEPLLLTILGLAVFDLGYHVIARGRRKITEPTEVPSPVRQYLLAFGVTLVLLSLLAHAYEVARFGPSGFLARMHEFRDVGRVGTGPIEVVKQTLGLGLGVIAVALIRRRWIVVWLLLASPAMVLSGSKFAFLMYLFPTVIFIRYSTIWFQRRELSLRRAAAIFGLVVLLAGSVGMMTLYRRNAQLIRALDWSSPAAYGTVFRYSIRAFDRFHTFEVFALTLEQYETRDLWRRGDWIADVFRQFIPRAIWRNKPPQINATVTQFVRRVSGGNYSYPPFVIGLFLFDFGIAGLVVLMLLFGAGLASAYRTLVLERSGVLPRLTYAFGIYLLLQVTEGAIHPAAKFAYVSVFVSALYVFYLHIVPGALIHRADRLQQQVRPHHT
jgi:hypothetical protein